MRDCTKRVSVRCTSFLEEMTGLCFALVFGRKGGGGLAIVITRREREREKVRAFLPTLHYTPFFVL